MKNIPRNEYDMFLTLVRQAHIREGPHLAGKTRWELEKIADEIGFSYDERNGIDYGNEIVEEDRF